VTGTSKCRLIRRGMRSEYLQIIRKFDNSHVILHSEGSTIYTDYNESEIYTEARTYTVQCAVKAARPSSDYMRYLIECDITPNVIWTKQSREVCTRGTLLTFLALRESFLEREYLSTYSDGLQAGWLGFHSLQRKEIFLYYARSRPALGPSGLLLNEYQGLFLWG
jgi:hypothetical protein